MGRHSVLRKRDRITTDTAETVLLIIGLVAGLACVVGLVIA